MKFSIITPSFRNSAWLKLCIASVADQGVELEHIVQDAGSDDGTLDWLTQDPRVTAIVEKDQGMYDAINRGWRRATGDILAYLNCDEQYLPGALKAVEEFFAAQPDVDFVVADAVIVDQQGEYICHRFALTPLKSHLWHRFSVLTCAMFVRRRVVQEMNIYFDPQWRALGDAFWIKEIAYRGVRTAVLRRFTSTFTETGENLGLAPVALRERAAKEKQTPLLVKLFKPLIILHHRWRLWASGAFAVKPFDYEVFTVASPKARVQRHAAKPTPRWVGR